MVKNKFCDNFYLTLLVIHNRNSNCIIHTTTIYPYKIAIIIPQKRIICKRFLINVRNKTERRNFASSLSALIKAAAYRLPYCSVEENLSQLILQPSFPHHHNCNHEIIGGVLGRLGEFVTVRILKYNIVIGNHCVFSLRRFTSTIGKTVELA